MEICHTKCKISIKSKKKKQEMAVAAYLSAKDKKKVAEAVIAKLKESK